MQRVTDDTVGDVNSFQSDHNGTLVDIATSATSGTLIMERTAGVITFKEGTTTFDTVAEAGVIDTISIIFGGRASNNMSCEFDNFTAEDGSGGKLAVDITGDSC